MSCKYDWNCPAGSFPYTIRKGDTLYSISRLYGSTPQRLLEVNPGIDEYNLEIGSKICIPQPVSTYPNCRSTNYYVVEENDTLYSIATYFGVTANQLLYSNLGIVPENIYKGMVLCIPIAPPPLCVKIKNNILTLDYVSGKQEHFNVYGGSRNFTAPIILKQLDGSTAAQKRLNLAFDGVAIANNAAKLSSSDFILSDSDMDYVFNRVPLGTEVSVL